MTNITQFVVSIPITLGHSPYCTGVSVVSQPGCMYVCVCVCLEHFIKFHNVLFKSGFNCKDFVALVRDE